MQSRGSCYTVVLFGIAVSSWGCPASAELNDVAATTPYTYTEDRVFPLIAYVESGTPDNSEKSKERKAYLQEFAKLAGSSDLTGQDKLALKHLDPVGVIVNGVYLPADLEGRRDIAVIVDIASSTDNSVSTLVVWYQRDVPGGQMLNFQDLLVYFDPAWNSNFAPFFRLRILDVKAERNRSVRGILEEASGVATKLGGLYPNPILPAVSVAIEAAKAILGNAGNEVLLDFSVQFYSQLQRQNAGIAQLNILRQGPWLVVGKNTRDTNWDWSNKLRLNFTTRKLELDTTAPVEGTPAKVIEAPYISVSIMAANAVVPGIVVERSSALLKLLSTQGGKGDVEGLKAQGELLLSSVKTYAAHEGLLRKRNKAALAEIRDLFATNEDHQNRDLSSRDSTLLLATVQRIVGPLQKFSSPKDFVEWFDAARNTGDVNPATLTWETNSPGQETKLTPKPPVGSGTGESKKKDEK
jgi:hypothetical protein